MLAELKCMVISGANKVANGEVDGTFYPICLDRAHKKEMSACTRHTCKAYLSQKILLWDQEELSSNLGRQGAKITENPLARFRKWKSITEVHSKLLSFPFLHFELLPPFYII